VKWVFLCFVKYKANSILYVEGPPTGRESCQKQCTQNSASACQQCQRHYKPQTKTFPRCNRQRHENITANKPMSGTFNKNTYRKTLSWKTNFPWKDHKNFPSILMHRSAEGSCLTLCISLQKCEHRYVRKTRSVFHFCNFFCSR